MPASPAPKDIAWFENHLHGLGSIPDPMPAARAALSRAKRICLLGGNSALSRLGYGQRIAETYAGEKEIVVVDDTAFTGNLPFEADSIVPTSKFPQWASQDTLAVNLATQSFAFFFFAGLLEKCTGIMELPLP